MDTQFYTREAAVIKATNIKTAYVASKLRLCKGDFVPTEFTSKAILVANEADYSGYPAGGYPLAAWSGPANFTGGGAVITSPLVTVTIVDPDPDPIVPNSISAWWVEDGTGNVRLVGTFSPPRSLATVLDAFPMIVQDVNGRNPATLPEA